MSAKPYRTITIKLANRSEAERLAVELRAKVDANVAGDIEES